MDPTKAGYDFGAQLGSPGLLLHQKGVRATVKTSRPIRAYS
jgi:hypothetical protein